MLCAGFAHGGGGFNHWQLRGACEQRWAPAAAYAEGGAPERPSGEYAEPRLPPAVSYVASLDAAYGCDAALGPLQYFALLCVAPAVGCATLLLTPLVFIKNTDPTALDRLIKDAKVLLLMLQKLCRPTPRVGWRSAVREPPSLDPQGIAARAQGNEGDRENIFNNQ